MNRIFKTIGIILAIVVFIVLSEPKESFASVHNQMINEDCLQNPEACNEEPAAETKEDSAVGITAWDYVKMLFALIFVLFLLVWVLKFVNKKTTPLEQNSSVRNIGGVSLGGQKSVQIVKIGDTLYIVGVGDDVQLIKEITNEDEAEKIMSYYKEKQNLMSPSPYIVELLKKFKRKSEPNQKESNSSFGEMFNQRISTIQKERQKELEKWKEKGIDE